MKRLRFYLTCVTNIGRELLRLEFQKFEDDFDFVPLWTSSTKGLKVYCLLYFNSYVVIEYRKQNCIIK